MSGFDAIHMHLLAPSINMLGEHKGAANERMVIVEGSHDPLVHSIHSRSPVAQGKP